MENFCHKIKILLVCTFLVGIQLEYTNKKNVWTIEQWANIEENNKNGQLLQTFKSPIQSGQTFIFFIGKNIEFWCFIKKNKKYMDVLCLSLV